MIANEMNEGHEVKIGNESGKGGKEKEMYECGASKDADHSECTENDENDWTFSNNEESSNELDKSVEGTVGILENIQDKKGNEQESGGRTRTKFPKTAANNDRAVELSKKKRDWDICSSVDDEHSETETHVGKGSWNDDKYLLVFHEAVRVAVCSLGIGTPLLGRSAGTQERSSDTRRRNSGPSERSAAGETGESSSAPTEKASSAPKGGYQSRTDTTTETAKRKAGSERGNPSAKHSRSVPGSSAVSFTDVRMGVGGAPQKRNGPPALRTVNDVHETLEDGRLAKLVDGPVLRNKQPTMGQVTVRHSGIYSSSSSFCHSN
jgi:hypothetical protein